MNRTRWIFVLLALLAAPLALPAAQADPEDRRDRPARVERSRDRDRDRDRDQPRVERRDDRRPSARRWERDDRRGDRRVVVRPWHRYERPRAMRALPGRHQTVRVGGRPFYFSGGLFFERRPGGYVMVTAPIGARLSALPRGHRTIVRGGVTFFLRFGTYYRYVPEQRVYVVAAPPADDPERDLLFLRDGEVMEGHVLSNDGRTIDFLMDGEIYEIPVDDVASIEFARD